MPSISKRINIYSKEQMDERQIGFTDDVPNQNGTLWARIKNALTRIGVLETADTQNVKKTGSVVTGALEVPTTPPTIDSAVNQAYVESTVNGVNNLIHKTGNEIKTGVMTFRNNEIKQIVSNRTGGLKQYDNNGNLMMELGCRYATSALNNIALQAYAPPVDPTDPDEVIRGGFIQLIANQDGTLELAIYGKDSSGNLIRKSIAYFNGTVWA